jgi:hypothetical protein
VFVQVRVLLVTGLAQVPVEDRAGQDPADAAADVETAIFQKYGNTGAEYGAKVRCLCPQTSLAASNLMLGGDCSFACG